MKRGIVLFVLIVMLIAGCSESSGNEQLYFFDKDQYTPVLDVADGDVIFRPTRMEELDYMMKNLLEGEKKGLIAECTVIGGSYNRICLPESGAQILSNVYTPIRIDHIYFKGSSVAVNEGDSCFLHENYFYVTEEVPDLMALYGDDAVYLRGADPVVYGQQYIMYLYDLEKEPVSDIGTGTEQLLFPAAKDLYAFPVGTREETAQVLLDPDAAFWRTWEAVLDTYSVSTQN